MTIKNVINTIPLSMFLLSSFILSLYFSLNFSFNSNFICVYGHSLVGNNNENNNGTLSQSQINGNYKIELSTNPSNILSNKSIDILLRITSLSNASTGAGGSEIIEIPAILSLIKNDKVSNLQHTPVIISGGHYSFKSIFPTVGKYLLFVDVKDIYFTNKVLNFVFELNVTDSHMNQ
ncbi:MAG: hypothetical protein ACTHJ2_03960, partial [Candidatus Nitrosocosmicus sp.]